MPLTSVMSETYDGRTKTGLRKILERFVKWEKKNGQSSADHARLRNYDKLVRAAEQLTPQLIPNHEDGDLKALLAKVQKDSNSFPLVVQHALVARRIQDLVTAEDGATLVEVLNPISDNHEFDPLRPMLRNMCTDVMAKAKILESVLFEQVLLNLIASGEPASSKVKRLIGFAIKGLDGIDQLHLDDSMASLVNSWIGCCRFLALLLDRSADLSEYIDRLASNRKPLADMSRSFQVRRLSKVVSGGGLARAT